MRPGRFLKRLKNSPSSDESDQVADDASAGLENSAEVEEGVDEPSIESVDQSESAKDPERLFATDEELREAGIDPAELFSDGSAKSEAEPTDDGPGGSSSITDEPLHSEPDSDDDPEQEIVNEQEAPEPAGQASEQINEDQPESSRVVEDELTPDVDDQQNIGAGEEPSAAATLVSEDEHTLARSAVNAGFVITLATELRTPISSLRVSFDLLKDPDAVRNNPEESKRLIGNIERSISRLERQASDLLEVGYINTGSLSLIKQPINMSEPILAAIDISRSSAALRQVAIELEMEPDVPRVVADGFRLTQIMTHLLSNAIKFAPVGESVVISLSSGNDDAADNSGNNQSPVEEDQTESVIVRVTDSGPGIREAHFERIFEPFYRITGEGIEGGAGVGLGLSIVKGLVELHGGRVWVRSTPREHTEFGFSIPLV